MKIGLTYTISPDRELQDVQKHSNYLELLNLNENDKVIVFRSSENNSKEISECDGLILSGGIDIHPDLYSGSPNYCNAPKNFQQARDEFEKDILVNAIQKKIPILAICRGFQLINCVQGGTLIQDLGESLSKIHKVENKLDKAHGLKIENDSLLFEIVGNERTLVNSAHHQAIDRLGNDLKISCRSDDGTVEGIEWADKTDKAFFIGVQWHPERMKDFELADHPITKNIRERFLEEAKKHSESKNKSSEYTD